MSFLSSVCNLKSLGPDPLFEEMPLAAKDSGARLVIINLTPTPYDREADLVISEKAGWVMAEMVRRTGDPSRG